MLSTRKPLLIIGMIAAAVETVLDASFRTVLDAWKFIPDYPQYDVVILFTDIFVILALGATAASIVLVFLRKVKFAFVGFIATAVLMWFSNLPWAFEAMRTGVNFVTAILTRIPLVRLIFERNFTYPIFIAIEDLLFWVLIVVGIIGLQKPRAKRPVATPEVNQPATATAINTSAQDVAPAYVPSSGMSVAALVLVFFIPVVGLILGYISRNEIARSQGRLGGMNYSKIAIVLGWIFIGLGILGGIIYGIVAASLVSAYY